MIYMIAVVKDKLKNIIGFRLLDTTTGKVMDTRKDSVILDLRQRKVKIENLVLKGDTLIGYNGSIDRYPVLNSECKLVGKSSIIILGITKDGKFNCADFKGGIVYIKEEELVRYAKVNGIANGKIVSDKVYCIEGHYTKLSQEKSVGGESKEYIMLDNIEQKISDYKAKSKLIGLTVLNIEVKNDIVVVTGVEMENKKVFIPNFVGVIGRGAFIGCTEIEEVTINDGLVRIDDSAFQGCGVREINLPDTIEFIGKQAFEYCDRLAEIIMPNSIKEIGDAAFHCCYNIRKVVVSNGVNNLKSATFMGCESLTDIILPDSIVTLGARVFDGCSSLKNLRLPSLLKDIQESAFEECVSLIEIDIPDSVKSIGESAFKYHMLDRVEFGENIKSIGEKAFFPSVEFDGPTVFIVPNNEIGKQLSTSAIPKEWIKLRRKK